MSSTVPPATIDIATVARLLGDDACRFDIDVLPECGSTNAELLARAEQGAPSGTVIVAEHQTDGRGRRGRSWISAPGDSLTFSLLWRFASGTVPMGLSLAAGIGVVHGLAKVGVPQGFPSVTGGTALRLKWPNDILLDARKLGGILVELVSGAPHAAVIGIGINRRLPTALPVELRSQVAALCGNIDANALLAAILRELRNVLERFGSAGFAGLRHDWTALHAFENTPVTLINDFDPPRSGLCRGADTDGALLFEIDGRIERVLSGEVSLRPCP